MTNDQAIQRGIENVYSLAAMHAQEAAMSQHNVEIERGRPFVIYGARVFRDGNQWCALLGEDIITGVTAFGASPSEAVNNFDKAWHKEIANDH